MTLTGPRSMALAVLDLARAGRFAEIRERFTPGLRPMVTAEALKAAWDAEAARLGPVASVGDPSSEPTDGQVRVPVRFERGELTLLVSVTATGELAGLQLVPAGAAEPAPWQPPPYADGDRFDEREVSLGEGPLSVPGTLCLPRTAGPFPGLLIVGGSGPVDREGTIARSKPSREDGVDAGLQVVDRPSAKAESAARSHGRGVASGVRRDRKKCGAQSRGEPDLICAGRPASFDGEDAVNLGRHERVKDVGALGDRESLAERATVSQCLYDPGLAEQSLAPGDGE